MSNRFFVIKQRNVSKIYSELLNKTGLKFGSKVKVNAFGNHAGNCVDKGLNGVLAQLKKVLPTAEFSRRVLPSYSALSINVHALSIRNALAKHRPEFIKDEAALRDYSYFLAEGGLTRRTMLKRLPHAKTIFDLGKTPKRTVLVKRKK